MPVLLRVCPLVACWQARDADCQLRALEPKGIVCPITTCGLGEGVEGTFTTYFQVDIPDETVTADGTPPTRIMCPCAAIAAIRRNVLRCCALLVSSKKRIHACFMYVRSEKTDGSLSRPASHARYEGQKFTFLSNPGRLNEQARTLLQGTIQVFSGNKSFWG